MVLETERLILDTWAEGDWPALRPVATDPEVMRYITGGVPWTDERIRIFVERQRKCYQERAFCRWKLVEKGSGEVIGFCGAGKWRDEMDPELGWWLGRQWWGRGLATEAARVALRDFFERVGSERVISVAMPENAASLGIMRKLGLQFECEFECEGQLLVRYAIARSQYC